MSRFSASAALAFALLALPIAFAACGGSSGSGDPTSAKYDPAHTTLNDAGLEACSEADNQIPQTMASGPGVQNARAFFVAKDCMGKETSPNTAMVVQYDSKQSVDAAYANVKTAIPNSSSAKYPVSRTNLRNSAPVTGCSSIQKPSRETRCTGPSSG